MRTVTKDLIMHLLAEHHGEKLLGLIGIRAGPVARATKLPAEVVDPDCLWDLGDCLVNLEMETNMGPDMAWRLFEYRARVRMQRHLRDRPLHQHVLVLDGGSPPGRPRTASAAGAVRVSDHDEAWFTYRVHLLRNIDPALMLEDPVTAVFAPLGRAAAPERPSIVRTAAGVIASSALDDRDRLLECLAVIASMRIADPTTIENALQEVVVALDITQSSIVKPHLDAARAEGLAEGLAEGRIQGILGMLAVRFDGDERITEELAQRLADSEDPVGDITRASTIEELIG